jgi:glycosyltransferase involved in cell wall biosynthesis
MQEISVVVLTKNSEKLLEECLQSIVKNKPCEIIIIDDGSTDKTLEISNKYTNQIYHNGRGVGFGRQLGAEKANKDLIAYVDSDTILPENCLQRMLLDKRGGGYHAIQAQILSLKNTTYWQWGADQCRQRLNKPWKQVVLNTTAIIFDKDVILKHSFDTLFTASSGSELSYRLKGKGYRLGTASVGVYHLHRESFKDWVRQRIWRGEGKALFIYKYKHTMQAIRLFLSPPYVILCSLLFSIKYGQIKLFPYLLLDGIFQEIGLLRELTRLSLTGKRTSG